MDNIKKNTANDRTVEKKVSGILSSYFTLSREVYLNMQREKTDFKQQSTVNSQLFEILECVDQLPQYFITHDIFCLRESVSSLYDRVKEVLLEDKSKNFVFKTFANNLKDKIEDLMKTI